MTGIVSERGIVLLEEILMDHDADEDLDRMRKIVVDHHFIGKEGDLVLTVLEVQDQNQGI